VLKMISGLVAAVSGLAKRAGGDDDRILMDWLERKAGGGVVFKWSTTGRGWRLREALPDESGESSVRATVRREMLRVGWNGLDPFGAPPPTDTQMLDWLDKLGGSYTGRVIWRMSSRGHGWRLHETSQEGAAGDVRTAIRNAMEVEA